MVGKRQREQRVTFRGEEPVAEDVSATQLGAREAKPFAAETSHHGLSPDPCQF